MLWSSRSWMQNETGRVKHKHGKKRQGPSARHGVRGPSGCRSCRRFCSHGHDSKTAAAMASAAELLASHCAEIAQLAGAGHDRVSDLRAVDATSPGDLMTLTAAATGHTQVEEQTRWRCTLKKQQKCGLWCLQ
ncbi:uncharacterized protein LOC133901646 [Phragmites australis]|uniref:uncharacterized protein LOC133901646 n=1 Tax=Phragmites australis TaxID=29695 RepID=UPI002D767A83|nr:uncharacterized protein LOC133901646 [Phragmites australis]